MLSCKNRYKDTNLKAIHNDAFAVRQDVKVVKTDTKIQI